MGDIPEAVLFNALQSRPLILRFDADVPGAPRGEEVVIEAQVTNPKRRVRGTAGTPLTVAVNAGGATVCVHLRFLCAGQTLGEGVVDVPLQAEGPKWRTSLPLGSSLIALLSVSVLQTGSDRVSLPVPSMPAAPLDSPASVGEPEFSESHLIEMLSQAQSREGGAARPAGLNPAPAALPALSATPQHQRSGATPTLGTSSPPPHASSGPSGSAVGNSTPHPHRLPVTATPRPRPKPQEYLPTKVGQGAFLRRKKVAQLRLAKARLAVGAIPKLAAWQTRLYERTSDIYDTETAQRLPVHTTFTRSERNAVAASALDEHVTWLRDSVAAPGDALDELLAVLRTNLPGEGDRSLAGGARQRALTDELACMAHLLSLSEEAAVSYTPPLEFMEHVVMRLVTMRPEDIDRDFGFADMPPLCTAGEPASFTRARELYGMRYTDWSYTSPPPYRNGSLLAAALDACPKVHAVAVGVCRTPEDELWRAVPLASSTPAAPAEQYAPGDVFLWRHLSLAQRDRVEAETRLTGNDTPPPSLLLFRILAPRRTACLVPFTSYSSPDYLLSPLMQYVVEGVDTAANIVTVRCLPDDAPAVDALVSAVRADVLASSERLQKAVKRLELATAFGYDNDELDAWCDGQAFFADPPQGDGEEGALGSIRELLSHLPDVPCSVSARLETVELRWAELEGGVACQSLRGDEADARQIIREEAAAGFQACSAWLARAADGTVSALCEQREQLVRDLAYLRSDAEQQLYDAQLEAEDSVRAHRVATQGRLLPFLMMRAHLKLVGRCYHRLAAYRVRQFDRYRRVETLWRRLDFWAARVCYSRWAAFRDRRAAQRRGVALGAAAANGRRLEAAWGRWARLRLHRRRDSAHGVVAGMELMVAETAQRGEVALQEARDRAEMEGWRRGFFKGLALSAAEQQHSNDRALGAFCRVYELLAPLTDTVSAVDSAPGDYGESMAVRVAGAAASEITKLRRLCQTLEVAAGAAAAEAHIAAERSPSPTLVIESPRRRNALEDSFDALRELKYAILNHRDYARTEHAPVSSGTLDAFSPGRNI